MGWKCKRIMHVYYLFHADTYVRLIKKPPLGFFFLFCLALYTEELNLQPFDFCNYLMQNQLSLPPDKKFYSNHCFLNH